MQTVNMDIKPCLKDKIEIFVNNRILRKKKIYVVFVKDNKEVFFKYYFYKTKNCVVVDEKSFIFGDKDFYSYKNNPILFIYENQPHPIQFENNSNVSSELLKTFMESNIIEKLMSRNDGFLGMNVNKNMVFIVVGILLFIYLFTQGVFDTMM